MASGPYTLRRAFDAAVFLGACAVSLCGSYMLQDAGRELRATQLGPLPLPEDVRQAGLACNAKARDICTPSDLGPMTAARAFVGGALPDCFRRAACDDFERNSQRASLSTVRAFLGGSTMYLGAVVAALSWAMTRGQRPKR